MPFYGNGIVNLTFDDIGLKPHDRSGEMSTEVPQPKVIKTTKGREFDFLLVKVYMFSTRVFFHQKLGNFTLGTSFSVIKIATLVNRFVQFYFSHGNGTSNYGN